MFKCFAATFLLFLACASGGCRMLPSSASPLAAPTVLVKTLDLFVQPEADHEPMLTLLKNAASSVYLEADILTDKDVIDALIAAQRRGVQVRVLLDAMPSDSGPGNRPAINELVLGGVNAKLARPDLKINSKYIIVDNRLGAIGTSSLTNTGFRSFRAYTILDRVPADVAEMASVFEADWQGIEASVSDPIFTWGPEHSRGDLLALIDSSTRSLVIEANHLSDEEFVARVLAAVKRGVAVRAIFSPVKSGPDLDTPARNKLERGGVNVRLLKTPGIQGTLIVADGTRGFVGSAAMEPGLDGRRDLGLVTSDVRLVQSFTGNFLNDWDAAK